MLLIPATLKVSAMNGNTNNQNEENFFNFPANEEVSEFCFSENHEFNLTFEDLIKQTLRDRLINEDLRKYYDYIKENDADRYTIMNDLIEKFKEYNRKYFENKLKPFKEKNFYLNLNYYERFVNLIYEYSLKSLTGYIDLLGAQNVSTKVKIGAISKHKDYLIENIINSVIKRVIRDKVREKEENLNNVGELNKVMPFENFETFEEYDKYADDVAELQIDELCDPNKNLNGTIYSPDAWYRVYLGNVIYLTMREIFRKEGII